MPNFLNPLRQFSTVYKRIFILFAFPAMLIPREPNVQASKPKLKELLARSLLTT